MIIKQRRHEELQKELGELKIEFMGYANDAQITPDAQIWFNMAMLIEKNMSMLGKIQEVV